MSFAFRPLAEVAGVGRIKIGLSGPSRSGKTYTALRIAIGLAKGRQEDVFAIDTEGTMGIYKARFPGVRVALLEPPYTYARYQEAIDAAVKAGAKVVIVDSASHAHEGQGGLLEQHDAEMQRMAGDDYGKRERMKFAAWIKPKAAFTAFCNKLQQAGPHMVVCFRAKEKLKLVRNAQGKQEPIPMGWQPICTEGIEFEMTVMFVLPPNSKGVPDLGAEAAGLREPIDSMVREGIQFDENFGRMLAEWAEAGGAPANAPRETPLQAAEKAASEGTEALRRWWGGDGRAHQRALAGDLERLKSMASMADEPEINPEPPSARPSPSVNEARRDQIMAKLDEAGDDGAAIDSVIRTMGGVLKKMSEEAPDLYDEVMKSAQGRKRW